MGARQIGGPQSRKHNNRRSLGATVAIGEPDTDSAHPLRRVSCTVHFIRPRFVRSLHCWSAAASRHPGTYLCHALLLSLWGGRRCIFRL
jgi:hypothetical protein